MSVALMLMSVWAAWEAGRIAYELLERAFYAMHAPNCYYCHSQSYAEWKAKRREWRRRDRLYPYKPYWKA